MRFGKKMKKVDNFASFTFGLMSSCLLLLSECFGFMPLNRLIMAIQKYDLSEMMFHIKNDLFQAISIKECMNIFLDNVSETLTECSRTTYVHTSRKPTSSAIRKQEYYRQTFKGNM